MQFLTYFQHKTCNIFQEECFPSTGSPHFLQQCQECLFGCWGLISIPVISRCSLCSSTLSLTNDVFVKAAAAFLSFARRQKGFICHTHTELLLALFKNLFGLWQMKGRGNMQTRFLPSHVLSYAFRVFRLMTNLIF